MRGWFAGKRGDYFSAYDGSACAAQRASSARAPAADRGDVARDGRSSSGDCKA